MLYWLDKKFRGKQAQGTITREQLNAIVSPTIDERVAQHMVRRSDHDHLFIFSDFSVQDISTENKYLWVFDTQENYLILEIPEGYFNEIPGGRYRMKHRAGQMTRTASVVAYDFSAQKMDHNVKIDYISARESFATSHGDFQLQVFYVVYSDDKTSDGAGQIVPIVPIDGHPRQAWEPEGLEIDKTETLEGRYYNTLVYNRDQILEGLNYVYSGYDPNIKPLWSEEQWRNKTANKFKNIPYSGLDQAETLFGTVYRGHVGNATVFWMPPAALEACFEWTAKHSYWNPFQYSTDSPEGYTPQQSKEWLKKYGKSAGHEFHEWNSTRN